MTHVASGPRHHPSFHIGDDRCALQFFRSIPSVLVCLFNGYDALAFVRQQSDCSENTASSGAHFTSKPVVSNLLLLAKRSQWLLSPDNVESIRSYYFRYGCRWWTDQLACIWAEDNKV